MTYRVVQWATGGVGKAAIEGILDHPDLELVGCWVHTADKVGEDAANLAGREECGVSCTNSLDDIISLKPDCVLYSPLYPTEAELVGLLQAGINVVTPLGWVYPFHSVPMGALEAACLSGTATLHGSGIHPGGMTERFPIMLSSMTRAATYVRSEEFSDIRTYGAPEVVGELMGFGKSAEEALAGPIAGYLAQGFCQSIDMIADAMGFRLDAKKNTIHEVAVATQPIPSPVGELQPGQVAAQRFTWQGTVDGEPVIEAIVNWFMGEEHFDQDWSFGEQGPRFEIQAKGDPDISAVFHGFHPHSVAEGLVRNEGIVATAMHCVNAIPYVCEAEAGIRSYLDLPLIAGRAAPGLNGH